MEYQILGTLSEVLNLLIPSLETFNAFMSGFVPIFFVGAPAVSLLILVHIFFGPSMRRVIVGMGRFSAEFWNRIDWSEPLFGDQVLSKEGPVDVAPVPTEASASSPAPGGEEIFVPEGVETGLSAEEAAEQIKRTRDFFDWLKDYVRKHVVNEFPLRVRKGDSQITISKISGDQATVLLEIMVNELTGTVSARSEERQAMQPVTLADEDRVTKAKRRVAHQLRERLGDHFKEAS